MSIQVDKRQVYGDSPYITIRMAEQDYRIFTNYAAQHSINLSYFEFLKEGSTITLVASWNDILQNIDRYMSMFSSFMKTELETLE